MEIIIEEKINNSQVYDLCINNNINKLRSRLYAKRIQNAVDLDSLVNPRLRDIQDVFDLNDSEKASKLIAKHIINDNHIVVVTDYDLDGCTSAAVLHLALADVFRVNGHKLTVVVNERKNGNGINKTLVKELTELNEKKKIDLIISADHGSSDEDRFKILKKLDIEMCITDHHLIPHDNFPHTPDCFINPQNDNCNFDNSISGCAVAYFTMLATRLELIKVGHISDETKLQFLLPLVAISTIGDSMSLLTPINRAIVTAGIKELNTLTEPIWQVMSNSKNNSFGFNSIDVSFGIVPIINAAGRMGNARSAYEFLISKSTSEAHERLKKIEGYNTERRNLTAKLKDIAIHDVDTHIENFKYGIAIALPYGFGINGIISGNIGEKYGKPAVVFVEQEGNTMAGSGRGIIPIVNVREAYEYVKNNEDGIVINYGGHAGAAGVSIHGHKLKEFNKLFNEAIALQLDNKVPTKVVYTDGELSPEELNFSITEDIKRVGPYGMNWPEPVFNNTFIITGVKRLGSTHLKLGIRLENGNTINAIYFNGHDPKLTVPIYSRGNVVSIIYTVSISNFGGRNELQLIVQHINFVG